MTAVAIGGSDPAVHPVARMVAGLARVISGVQVRWVEPETDTRQRVYFANHTSHLDAVVLWAALPRERRALTRPVAAADYWERTRLRRFLAERVFRSVLIPRRTAGQEQSVAAARAVIERMAEALGDRHSLIVFPEGTRGDGTDVAKFRSGLYHLAQIRPDVDLVPVYLDNLNRILPKGEVLPVPLVSTATFGHPLGRRPDEPKESFLLRAREAVCSLAPVSVS